MKLYKNSGKNKVLETHTFVDVWLVEISSISKRYFNRDKAGKVSSVG